MAAMFGIVLVGRVLAGEWMLAAADLGLVFACGGAPWLLALTGRFYLVSNAVLGLVFAILVVISLQNPNPGLSAATAALAEIPLFAMMIFGTRYGYGWSVACGLAVLLLGVNDFGVWYQPTPEERAAFNEHVAAVVMCGTLVSAGLFYERGKNASLARISALEALRREAELEAVRANANEQVRQTERLASMGRLAASVAHEINNPLSFIQGNLAFVQQTLHPAPTALDEALTDSLEGLRRIQRIVADLRTFTRPTEPTEQGADVARAVRSALSMAQGHLHTKARVEERIEHGLLVSCDEARLVQVLLNLIVNAAQALPQGLRDQHLVAVRAESDGEEATLEVEDNGPGIPEALLARVREPFFTTKPVGEGTGLGLALSERIVRDSRGTLTIESAPGCTLVRITLPVDRTSSPPLSQAREIASTTVTRSLRILICDDEELVARALKRHLREHEVTLVDGGQKALDLFAAGAVFDLVLCDVMMPNVSGTEVHEVVRNRYPHLMSRLVFMSGGTYTEQAQAFRDQMENRFIQKPLSLVELKEVVQAMHGLGIAAPMKR
ncbi:MAG: ATP-binding protein [Sandaracinaceae bacterium]